MIITIKLNKGGSGKSFVSVQLASALAELEEKTLLLTTDSQNNHFDFLGLEPNGGDLRKAIEGKNHNITKGRKNLDLLHLDPGILSNSFFSKLEIYLNSIKKKYKYIIIDGAPTRGIDDHLLSISDKIIIPLYCDKVTINGALQLIEGEAGEKVLALIPNRFREEKVQREYLELLKEALEDKDVLLTDSIKHKSYITKWLEKGKTIWESRSKEVEDIKDIFTDVIKEVLENE